MKYVILIGVLSLTACSGYRMPMTGTQNMSGDTLCYRYAYAKDDPAIRAEIAARGLDCAAILANQGEAF